VDVEQAKHQDLIRITDVYECYRNLGGKLKAAYQWGILNTPARWFVKTDDDSFLRVSSLSYYLLKLWPDATVPREIKRRMKWVKSSYFTGSYMWRDGECEDSDKFSIGHNISPEKMRKCYEMMDENKGAEKVLKELESKMELQRIAACGKRDCWRQGLSTTKK